MHAQRTPARCSLVEDLRPARPSGVLPVREKHKIRRCEPFCSRTHQKGVSMRSRVLVSSVATTLAASLSAAAQSADEAPAGQTLEQVVITATRAPTGVARDVIGSSITVLEPKALEE